MALLFGACFFLYFLKLSAGKGLYNYFVPNLCLVTDGVICNIVPSILRTSLCIICLVFILLNSQVFRRHPQNGRNVEYNKEMSKINQQVEKLHQQFQIRASGENGVAKGLINMSNPMESWLVWHNLNRVYSVDAYLDSLT